MKYLLILGDGMADEPVPELGDRTPFEIANKPNMDRIVREGRCGMLRMIPDSHEPGSDVANLSIMGYDPSKYYTGRGALEAVSMGIPFGLVDLAYRCNFVTVENGKMKDFAAGHISSEEGKKLFVSLQERFNEFGVRLYPGISYRNVLMLPNGKGSLTKAPVPFAVLGRGKDEVSVYTEKEIASKGEYGLVEAVDLIKIIFAEI
jgi:2,3-bisphosphoglycerate-independent phosphoglycerate mutase